MILLRNILLTLSAAGTLCQQTMANEKDVVDLPATLEKLNSIPASDEAIDIDYWVRSFSLMVNYGIHKTTFALESKCNIDTCESKKALLKEKSKYFASKVIVAIGFA